MGVVTVQVHLGGNELEWDRNEMERWRLGHFRFGAQSRWRILLIRGYHSQSPFSQRRSVVVFNPRTIFSTFLALSNLHEHIFSFSSAG